MRSIAVASFVFLLLCASHAGAQEGVQQEPPRLVTLREYVADPAALHQIPVRLTVTFNVCQPRDCRVCDVDRAESIIVLDREAAVRAALLEDAEEALLDPAYLEPREALFDTCVAVNVTHFPLDTSIDEIESKDELSPSDLFELSRLSVASSRFGDRQREKVRYATATVEGRFDASCTLNYDPDVGPDPERIVVRACPPLDVERIVEFHERPPATRGLGGAIGAVLRPAAGDDRERMVAAALEGAYDLWWEIRGSPNGFEAFVFEDVRPVYGTLVGRLEGDYPPTLEEAGVDRVGAVCLCRFDMCESIEWPFREGHLIEAPGNPYMCWRTHRVDGDWRVLLTPSP